MGGCLSSLDERDLENRNGAGTAGVTSAGSGGTGGSAGGAGGAGGNRGGTGGTAGSVSQGGSAGTVSEGGRGGGAGDATSSTGGASGSAGVASSSGAGGNDGSPDSGGQGGDTSSGGNDNTSGSAGDGGTAGSTGGSSGTAGSSGMAGNGGGAGTTMLPPIEDGDPGFATRYWDCCKPTCAWDANVPDGTPARSCGRNDEGVAESSQNACAGGTAYACHSLAPWAANDQLAYGYVASSKECGRCYELQFTGTGHFSQTDAGSVAVRDRHMFVQVIQHSDVPLGQFDLLIPGGGVGAFNACSTQWGVNANELGAQYGGIASNCTTQSSDLATRKNCVRETCADVFADLPELRAGCDWFIDWLSLADNPDVVFREIECPAELLGRSGLDGGF